VGDAQSDEALVQAAVGVDLRHDLLPDVAALRQAEGGFQPGLLRVHVLVDVDAEERGAGFDPQAVARDDPSGGGAGGPQGVPERGGQSRAAVQADPRGSSDLDSRHDDLPAAEISPQPGVVGFGRQHAGDFAHDPVRLRSAHGQRCVAPGHGDPELLGEVIVLEGRREAGGGTGGDRDPERVRTPEQVEFEEHLALAREQEAALTASDLEGPHVAREDAVQEAACVLAVDLDPLPVGLVEERAGLERRAVFPGHVPVGQQGRGIAGIEARTGAAVQSEEGGSIHGRKVGRAAYPRRPARLRGPWDERKRAPLAPCAALPIASDCRPP
jgi:hypothetical protein